MQSLWKLDVPHCPDALSVKSGRIRVGMYELVDGHRTGGLIQLDSSLYTTLLTDVGVLFIDEIKQGSLIACSDGTIRLIDNDSRVLSQIRVTTETDMKAVVMAVTGNFKDFEAASITTAGELQLSDLSVGREVWSIAAHSRDWESWIVASDGESTVATGSDDRSFRLFDRRDTACVFSSKHHESGVTWLDFDRTRNLMISGSYDENLCHWDLRNLSAGPTESWKCEGGVWRAKRLGDTDRFLVTMCYGGFAFYEAGNKLSGSCSDGTVGLCYGAEMVDNNIVALDFYAKTVSMFPSSL